MGDPLAHYRPLSTEVTKIELKTNILIVLWYKHTILWIAPSINMFENNPNLSSAWRSLVEDGDIETHSNMTAELTVQGKETLRNSLPKPGAKDYWEDPQIAGLMRDPPETFLEIVRILVAWYYSDDPSQVLQASEEQFDRKLPSLLIAWNQWMANKKIHPGIIGGIFDPIMDSNGKWRENCSLLEANGDIKLHPESGGLVVVELTAQGMETLYNSLPEPGAKDYWENPRITEFVRISIIQKAPGLIVALAKWYYDGPRIKHMLQQPNDIAIPIIPSDNDD